MNLDPVKNRLEPLKRSPFLLPIVISGTAILIFLILLATRPGIRTGTIQERTWNVAVITAERGDHTPNMILHGITESPRKAVIETAINADVIETTRYEGNYVKKGDLLIKLDDREVKFQLDQRIGEVNDIKAQIESEKNRAEADKAALEHEKVVLKLSKRALQRQVELTKQLVGSEAALDQAKQALKQQELKITAKNLAVKDHISRHKQLNARLKRAEAMKGTAELDVARSQLSAPFDGRITKLYVAVGNRVQKGERLIAIYDTSSVEVRSQIPAQYVSDIYQALQKGLSLRAEGVIDGQPIKLTLDRLSGVVGRQRGGVDALLKVVERGKHLALGRSLELVLDLPTQKNVIQIPNQALYGTNKVYLLKNDRMQAVKVYRLGFIHQMNGKSTLIIGSDEIKAGDKIIITQLPNARTGLRVKAAKEN